MPGHNNYTFFLYVKVYVGQTENTQDLPTSGRYIKAMS